MTRLNGIVKWFSPENGFGFIEAESKETGDIFVDYSSIQADGFKTLGRGQKVEFEFEKDERGNVARNVIIIK
ncbi:MAG: cold-shock protein [Actinobacteria bacterium]|nr:cold-shock protein [Actinomycetota bacterium]